MNATTKHTPGPWEIEYGHNGLPRGVIQSEGRRGLFAHDRSREEREANANLIVAATDLLESCEELLDYCAQTNAPISAALNRALAAIAKATGENP